MSPEQRAQNVLAAIKRRYPEAGPHLAASGPWQVLVATVLSAQCTDARVNQVTPELFRRWPDAVSLAQVSPGELEQVIGSVNFFRNKARHLIAAARRVVEVYDGQTPDRLEELVTLPGVARKTANVVLFNGFGLNQGLAVDTHVKRICRRLGLTEHDDPVDVEQDLMRLFPQEEWGGVNQRLVSFGREVCTARKPRCPDCELREFCPSAA